MSVHKSKYIGLLAILFLYGCSAPAIPDTDRPENWAQPTKKPGLPNLHRINEYLFRGAQPSAEGFQSLQKMGVRTIINLRALHDDEDEIEKAGLAKSFKIVAIPANAWDVSQEEVIEFLQVIGDSANHPVFFHCKHGADRTGTMAAAYRMVMENWTSEAALEEMTNGGFGFHSVWKNLPRFIAELNVAEVKRAL